jgi:5-formyltetrahydrofolate cyclo-ligase
MANRDTIEPLSARNDARRAYRKARNSLSQDQQSSAAITLTAQFKQHSIYASARRVALYLSNDGEVSTEHLIDHLWEHKTEVYLPVLHPFASGYLLFLRYQPHTPMKKNRFGILEPTLDCSAVCPASQLDIIFTPLVAFDVHANRLGMGGGFYDRTLAGIKSSGADRPAIVGLAHECQKSANLPVETWDIPLSYVQTPLQLYPFT